MTLYDDPIEMVRDIRSHVLEYGHTVAVSDTPLNFAERAIGYICMGCANGCEVPPQAVIWNMRARDIDTLKYPVMLYGVELQGLLESQEARDRLTQYLNGMTGFDLDTPSVPVIDRYHRPWLI